MSRKQTQHKHLEDESMVRGEIASIRNLIYMSAGGWGSEAGGVGGASDAADVDEPGRFLRGKLPSSRPALYINNMSLNAEGLKALQLRTFYIIFLYLRTLLNEFGN